MKEEMNVNIVLHEKRCKGCGICAAFCPKHVFDINPGEKVNVARPGDCIACRMCELRCPDLALEVVKS